jgi:hypothetical protein
VVFLEQRGGSRLDELTLVSRRRDLTSTLALDLDTAARFDRAALSVGSAPQQQQLGPGLSPRLRNAQTGNDKDTGQP